MGFSELRPQVLIDEEEELKRDTTMTTQERTALRAIAEAVTERFPGTHVAFEDFANPALDMSSDGILSLYVLNVPSSFYEAVYQYIFGLTNHGRGEINSRIAFSIWTPEQTRESFSDEILRLQTKASVPVVANAGPGASWQLMDDDLHGLYLTSEKEAKWDGAIVTRVPYCPPEKRNQYDRRYSHAA
jgi:hypothetical protein